MAGGLVDLATTTPRDTERDWSGDLTAGPLHAADRGTDTMQAELDASSAARVSRELAKIDVAPGGEPRRLTRKAESGRR